jgi:hypothetical protein
MSLLPGQFTTRHPRVTLPADADKFFAAYCQDAAA